MIRHYLKIAYRNFLQYKRQSVICLLGLAMGLACFTVCNYSFREELAWNNRLPYFDETYILTTRGEDGRVNTHASVELAGKLKAEFPEIEKSVFYINISGVCDKMCIPDYFVTVNQDYARESDGGAETGVREMGWIKINKK